MTTATKIAGAAAGAGLVLIELVFADDLIHAESAVLSAAVLASAFTAYSAGRGPDIEAAAVTVWEITIVACVPAVLAYLARRKAAHTRALGVRAGTIAERDYREERAPSARLRRDC